MHTRAPPPRYIEIAPESFEFTVRMSYFEIYMERIRDLLCDGNTNLQIHENRERGVYVSPALFALCLVRDEEDAAVEVGNKTVCMRVCVCV
jgi:hypothetical protein